MTVKRTVEITGKLDMYARPAMKLFELMQGFEVEILLHDGEEMETKANSAITLLILDSTRGHQAKVEATGPQEIETLTAMTVLFSSGFNES